jgi:hypothetical protein
MDGKNFSKLLEVLVDGEDRKSGTKAHRANEKIRIGTLDTFSSALVETSCSGFIVGGNNGRVEERCEVFF